MAPADTELNATLAALQQTIATLEARMASLEALVGITASRPAPEALDVAGVAPAPPVDDALEPGVVLAIAAAVAAYLGERAHVRQIRLISSQAWGQQGRVTVQASHTLHR
jgi:methylmalonyl-CoA carboxyltransferase large subunit